MTARIARRTRGRRGFARGGREGGREAVRKGARRLVQVILLVLGECGEKDMGNLQT